MINEIIGTIFQILLLTSIPFLVYVIQNKKAKGFFDYVGLKRSNTKANLLAVLTCILFAAPIFLLTFLSEDFKEIVFDPNSITGKFRQMSFGVNSLTLLIITAVFKTAFAEELFFRGFLAKRLIGMMGFVKGNLTQATLFGALHTAVFALMTSNPIYLLFIFFIPSIGSYINVYLNEQLANGSIIPGWISHGLANILSYSIIGFII